MRLRHHHLEAYRRAPAEFYCRYIDLSKEQDEVENVAMKLGSALDQWILSGNDRFVVIPDELNKRRGKDAAAEKAKLKQEALDKGVIWLSPAEYERVRHMHDQASKLSEFKTDFRSQVRLEWDCPHTGLPKRGSVDYVSSAMFADLKTTTSRNIHPDLLLPLARERGYVRQVQLYAEGFECGGQDLPGRITIIFVGSDRPWTTHVLEIENDELWQAAKENRETIDRLDESWAYNSWN